MAFTLHIRHPRTPLERTPAPTTDHTDGAAERVAMRVIPWWRVVGLHPQTDPTGPDGLHFVGTGPTDFVCGHCGAMIARSMRREHLAAAALLCSACSRWNSVSTPD